MRITMFCIKKFNDMKAAFINIINKKCFSGTA